MLKVMLRAMFAKAMVAKAMIAMVAKVFKNLLEAENGQKKER